MFLAAAFVALASVSCNKTGNSEYWTNGEFVTVEGLAGSTTFRTDAGDYLALYDSKVQISSSINVGDRLLILYSKADTQQSYATPYITLWGYVPFEYAATAIVQGDTSDYGTLPLSVYDNYVYPYSVIHVTKDVFDASLIFYGKSSNYLSHTFTVVLDEDEPTVATNKGKYLKLRICHQTTAAEADIKDTTVVGYYSFDLSQFAAYMDDTLGVQFVMNTGENDITREYPWPTI